MGMPPLLPGAKTFFRSPGSIWKPFPVIPRSKPPGLFPSPARSRPLNLAPVYDGEYFLPDPERLQARACPFPLRLLEKDALADLYRPEWSNALCEHRRELDRLAVGAYDGDALVGLAGCSADCETMWQIGVDVLPTYRNLGIAKALTSRLALETLRRGKVPFYCCGWANVPSARNALACGFRPAWAQLTVKPTEDSL